MEFGDVGAHCSHHGCHQQDFLPFRCKCCEKVFCLDHHKYADHQCPKAEKDDKRVIICSACHMTLPVPSSGTPNDEILAIHLTSGQCDPAKRRVERKRCANSKCRSKLTFINSLKCKECGLSVCMSHRFPSDHQCQPGRISAKNAAIARSESRSITTKTTNQRNAGASVGNSGPTCSAQALQEICPQCSRQFSDVFSLISHVEREHEVACS